MHRIGMNSEDAVCEGDFEGALSDNPELKRQLREKI